MVKSVYDLYSMNNGFKGGYYSYAAVHKDYVDQFDSVDDLRFHRMLDRDLSGPKYSYMGSYDKETELLVSLWEERNRSSDDSTVTKRGTD